MATLPDHIRATVERLIQQLNAAKLTIREAYVFGSYAKGRQTEWSDIDLALVSDHFEGDFSMTVARSALMLFESIPISKHIRSFQATSQLTTPSLKKFYEPAFASIERAS